MGRTLFVEESLEEYCSSYVGTEKQQVGLVLGQVSAAKDFAIHFARCPDPVEDEVEIEMSSSDDDVVVISNKQKKKDAGKAVDEIDNRWVIEHARQVNRMLTGGISVVGMYVICGPQFLNQNLAKLKQCLASVHKRTEKNKYIRRSLPHSDRYLIHFCTSSRKLTCKTIDLHDDQSSLRPAEFKFQQVLSGWTSVSCSVDVQIDFVVPEAHEAHSLEQRLIQGCQEGLDEIWNSYAVLGSSLVDEDAPIVVNIKDKGKPKTLNNSVDLVLHSEVKGSKSPCVRKENSMGHVKFIGSLCSKAYVHSKATFGDAVKALKADIIRSILARTELLCEEAEINNIYHMDEWSLVSPTRVFAPFKKSGIFLSDYIFKDEVAADSIGRFLELLNITPTEDCLSYLEHSPDSAEVSMMLQQGDRSPDMHSEIGSELSSSFREEEPQGKKVVGIAIAALAALFAAALNFMWNDSK